jgi:F0F1-type ATP synthase assembly protein I
VQSVARRSGWDAVALALAVFVPLGFMWLATFLAGGPDDPTAGDAVLLGGAATWIVSIAAIVLLLRAGQSAAWLAFGMVWFTVAVVVSLVTASATDPETSSDLISRTSAVSRALAVETGERPYRSTVDVDEFSLALPARAEVRRRYGDFVVEISEHPAETAARLGLAGDGPHDPAWDQSVDGSWAATKRYGDDLFLIWHADAKGALDDRWNQIDAVMERVARATSESISR